MNLDNKKYFSAEFSFFVILIFHSRLDFQFILSSRIFLSRVFELEAFGPDLTIGFVKTKMLREAVDPENLDENIMNSITDEMMKTKLNLEAKKDRGGGPITLKGLALTEKYLEDMKKQITNHFEAFKIEGIERGIEEFRKLATENFENMEKELKLLKKENAQLKEKTASLPKQLDEESYFDC